LDEDTSRGDILAFDLGQVTGWALLSKRHPLIQGTIRLANDGHKGNLGYRWNELEDRIVALIDEHPSAGEVWYEAPFMRFDRTASQHAALVTMGYAVSCEKAAARRRRPTFSEQANVIRRQVLGIGGFKDNETAKRTIKQWVIDSGLPFENEHSADAVAVAEWAACCDGWSLFQTKWYGDMRRAAEAET
jgi:Holliday junction resolvasome RuvABC endonuclease subunit